MTWVLLPPPPPQFLRCLDGAEWLCPKILARISFKGPNGPCWLLIELYTQLQPRGEPYVTTLTRQCLEHHNLAQLKHTSKNITLKQFTDLRMCCYNGKGIHCKVTYVQFRNRRMFSYETIDKTDLGNRSGAARNDARNVARNVARNIFPGNH